MRGTDELTDSAASAPEAAEAETRPGALAEASERAETNPVTEGGAPGDAEHASTAPALEGPMAQLRPGVPTAAPLARARVLGAMFGESSTAGSVGRFRVLDRLGAGGMGVVYEAYDPDLARGVALKLVHVAAADREAALAEAKALARLSHPNVVPIYDVGLDVDRVYLVMELVRGQTLRAWAPGRSVREILDVYQQAGRALAAAHDAGLVHRDFKPDNALVGRDHRVRVVDFGLACEADDPARGTTGPRAIAGTPRFMAPEAKAGAAITAAADQYSFCVALAEALEAAREPAPRRVLALLERGRADDPGQRFPAMPELLRALARDPSRTRRRAAALGAIAASVGAIAFVAGRQHAGDEDACRDGRARIEAVWGQPARSAQLAQLAQFGAYGASLRSTLGHGLDAHAARWAGAHRAACLDRRRGLETALLSDRRTACLDDGRRALAEVRALVTSADAASLIQLPRAVQALPDPAACADLAALATEVEPPPPALAPLLAGVRDQIAQTRILVGAGRYADALAAARAAAATARALDYRPLLAEALLVQGHAQLSLAPVAAIPVLTEAVTIANRARHRPVAIEAWARRAYARAVTGDAATAAAGVDYIESEAAGSVPGSFALALLYNNLGAVAAARQQRAEARAYFTRAVSAARQVTGAGALELTATLANLAIVTDDRRAADRLIAEAAAERARRLGDDHPDTLDIQLQRGQTTVEDLAAAARLLAPTCVAYELHKGYRAEDCWTELGMVRAALGELRGAAEAMARAARSSPDAVLAAGYARLWAGDARSAEALFARAIAAMRPAESAPWWDTLARATLTVGLGEARRALGDAAGARRLLERAVADLASIVASYPVANFERWLGRARIELVAALRAAGAPRAEVAAVASPAHTWLARVGGSPRAIAELVSAGGSTN